MSSSQRTDEWRARSTAYDLLRKQYDELAADNARLLALNDAAAAENQRLREALDNAAGRLGYLSTVLSLSNKSSKAGAALAWSDEARAAAGESRS